MCMTIRYELDTDSYCLFYISLKYHIVACVCIVVVVVAVVVVVVFASYIFFTPKWIATNEISLVITLTLWLETDEHSSQLCENEKDRSGAHKHAISEYERNISVDTYRCVYVVVIWFFCFHFVAVFGGVNQVIK